MDVTVGEHPALVRRRQQAAGEEQSFRFVEVRQRLELFGEGALAAETFFFHMWTVGQDQSRNKAGIAAALARL